MVLNQQEYTPEQISAKILEKIRKDAEDFLKKRVNLAQKEAAFCQRGKESFLGLLEIMDALETREVPDLENEIRLEIVKNGYPNTQDNSVLRKAEVITVRNAS